MFKLRVKCGAFTMLIFLNVGQVLPIGALQVVEPGHTSRTKLAHSVESLLGVVNGMVEALHISTDVVRCTANQLRLECQPVN